MWHFQDLLYIEINVWKESDKVGCTQFGNPHMASFRAKWEARGESQEDDDGFNLDELHDALDVIALIDAYDAMTKCNLL
ncbi:hypothetical protein L914_10307 [Phytophthora nicotianae]|uniref:Uncharacterized protein n=1 Tax=Phytophthora nicotianae TaxID=4792 RepID=W2N7E6_PHYNI|nr:hypothetical protein L914_10307 [Phytophthora nicotianae]